MSYQILEISIIQTLVGSMNTHKQNYLYMSQARLLELLKKYHDLTPSRRTLNTYLKNMERKAWIARTRRIGRNPDGTIKPLATMYHLGPGAFQYLRSMAKRLGKFFGLTEVQKAAHNCRLHLAILFKSQPRTQKKGEKHLKTPPPNDPLSYPKQKNDLERIQDLRAQAKLILNS